ncbi:Membrane-associating domain-containing protein [Aspergillus sp. HF37]|nr:Membrane-associating domain-containing protein [Aspergillus sp. HF37]
MPAKILQPAVYALLGTGLVFAIVELGLSAYIVSSLGDRDRDGSWNTYDFGSIKKRQDFQDYYDEYDYGDYSDYSDYSDYNFDSSSYYDIATPPIAIFAIFASVWTIVVSVGALFTAWFFSRKSPVSRVLNMIFAAAYVAVYFITMAFWLGTFADYAYVQSWAGYTSDYWNATLAFAVLLCLVFLALLSLTVLAIFGILHSDWPGYTSIRKRHAAPPAAEPAPGPQTVQPGLEVGQVRHEGAGTPVSHA